MILFFSGTGNSRYVAEMIGRVTGDTIVSINELLKTDSREEITSDMPLVFVCPTYAWRMPRVLEEFIQKCHFSGSRKAYFVLTCGATTGNAVQYTKRICSDKGLEYSGFASVVMPSNYIVLYEAPTKAEADETIQRAVPQILDIAEKIKREQPLHEEAVPIAIRYLNSVVNSLFYLAFVSAKGFYSTEGCTSCGTCATVCPLNNIEIVAGRPQWGRTCTHCMACISACPVKTIEYKKKTQGKSRYYLTEHPE